MKLLKDLQLADVRYEDEGAKAVLVFLDEERGEIREVNFNTREYNNDTSKFEDSEEKKAKVEGWCQEHFGLSFDNLTQAVEDGVKKDIYAYDTFNSLFEVKIVEKFDKELQGQVLQAVITEIEVDDIGIHIMYDYEGDTYRSNMNYAEYMKSMDKWFGNPQKKLRQEKRFEKTFHVPVDEADSLVGKDILVEVKVFNGNVFGEIKALPKPKK